MHGRPPRIDSPVCQSDPAIVALRRQLRRA